MIGLIIGWTIIGLMFLATIGMMAINIKEERRAREATKQAEIDYWSIDENNNLEE